MKTKRKRMQRTSPTLAHRSTATPTAPDAGLLSVTDAVCLILGIIIGATIFEAPRLIFENVDHPATGMAAWLLGGVVSLIGALCYAELATTYRSAGGDYTYLTRAYGRAVGFMFAWAELAVIRTGGSIAFMAYVFAKYLQQIIDVGTYTVFLYAAGSIALLTLINALGMQPGRRTQNLLTAAKVFGLAGIVVVGLLAPLFHEVPPATTVDESKSADPWASFALAMVFVFYAYGGWNEAAFVSADVREPKRNIVRSLVFGTLAVTGIYVIVNLAYLAALGFDGVRQSKAVAADVLGLVFGESGRVIMSALVVISALGSINGLLFTGVRLYGTFGKEHRLFHWLAFHPTKPSGSLGALFAQAGFSLLLISLIEFSPWWTYALRKLWYDFGFAVQESLQQTSRGSFDDLVTCTAPVFWLFFFLTGCSLFVLRFRDPDTERPFRVPLYPWIPLIFVASCAFMLYRSAAYALEQEPAEALVVVVLMLIGLPLCALSGWNPQSGSARRVAPMRRLWWTGLFMLLAGLALSPRATAQEESRPALLRVIVPYGATIEIDGYRTLQSGALRRFITPPLKIGKEYSYTLKVTYMVNATSVVKQRTITVRPGEEIEIDVLRAEAEDARKAAEMKAAAEKKAAEEAARKKAEAEALAKKKAEEEALAKKKAEQEALAKKKAEEEAAKKKAEEEAKKKAAEEAAKKDADKKDEPKKDEPKKDEPKPNDSVEVLPEPDFSKFDLPVAIAEEKGGKKEEKKDEKPEIVVPYVPTPQVVVEAMLKMANVKEGDVVYDLGCGDGRIVITAVKKFKAKKGLGIDFNPERIQDSLKNAKAADVLKQVEFRQGDVLKLTDVSEANVVTLYLLPDVNLKLMPVLKKTLKPGSRIVSHDFDMGDWKPEKTQSIMDENGIEHTIYLWTIPEKK